MSADARHGKNFLSLPVNKHELLMIAEKIFDLNYCERNDTSDSATLRHGYYKRIPKQWSILYRPLATAKNSFGFRIPKFIPHRIPKFIKRR